MATLTVNLGDRSYPVHVAPSGFDNLSTYLSAEFAARRVLLVTEETVGPLWASKVVEALTRRGFDVQVITILAGEENKTIANWSYCVSELLKAEVDRQTPVLALGGGVLGDIVGFASATVFRGVPYVQIPTTLLSMADSSVGGKTAVNHPRGKNLVGAFYQPRMVFACLETLCTLDPVEISAGLAEMLKIGLIADPALFDDLELKAGQWLRGDFSDLGSSLSRCIELKAAVVAQDEREEGWRAVLNLGHTVAHGLEATLGATSISHGQAVGLGLLIETRWAKAHGICQDPFIESRIEKALLACGLPTKCPELSKKDVVAAMRLDKKASGTTIKVPVLTQAGRVEFAEVPKNELDSFLEFI